MGLMVVIVDMWTQSCTVRVNDTGQLIFNTGVLKFHWAGDNAHVRQKIQGPFFFPVITASVNYKFFLFCFLFGLTMMQPLPFENVS